MQMNNDVNVNIDNAKESVNHKGIGLVPLLTLLIAFTEGSILGFLKFGMPIFKSGYSFNFNSTSNIIILGSIYAGLSFFAALISYSIKDKDKSLWLDFFMIIIGIWGFSLVLGILGVAAYFLLSLFLFGSNFFISLIVMAVVAFMVYKVMID